MSRVTSLERQLLGRLALAIGAALALGFGAVTLIHGRGDAAQERDALAVAGRTVGESIRHEMLAGKPDGTTHLLATFGASPPFTLLRLYGPDGTIARSSRPGEVGTRPLEGPAWEALRAQASRIEEPEVREADGSAHVLFALENEPRCQSCHAQDEAVNGYLGVTLSLERAGTARARERWALAATAAATAGALVIALRKLFSRVVLRRLARISAVIERAREGDLAARADDPAPDEIGALAARLNEALEALSKAQRAVACNSEQLDRLATLGQMTAGIVHELKNALGSASAAAQVLVSARLGEDDRRRFLVGIRDEIERLDQVLRGLVAFSRPARTRARPVDMAAAVETALELFQAAGGAPFEVRRRLSRDLPPVRGDPRLFEQVFLNLFLNARDARPSGLVLRVEAEALAAGRPSADAAPFGPLAGRETVRVRVADNGPGIDPAVRERLFEPFVTTKPEGTGLGLSVCHRIIAVHGGTIEAAAGPEGGTVFTILLPVEDHRPADGAAAGSAATFGNFPAAEPSADVAGSRA